MYFRRNYSGGRSDTCGGREGDQTYGMAAVSDEITPELPKYAETVISQALHELFGVVLL